MLGHGFSVICFPACGTGRFASTENLSGRDDHVHAVGRSSLEFIAQGAHVDSRADDALFQEEAPHGQRAGQGKPSGAVRGLRAFTGKSEQLETQCFVASHGGRDGGQPLLGVGIQPRIPATEDKAELLSDGEFACFPAVRGRRQ